MTSMWVMGTSENSIHVGEHEVTFLSPKEITGVSDDGFCLTYWIFITANWPISVIVTLRFRLISPPYGTTRSGWRRIYRNWTTRRKVWINNWRIKSKRTRNFVWKGRWSLTLKRLWNWMKNLLSWMSKCHKIKYIHDIRIGSHIWARDSNGFFPITF